MYKLIAIDLDGTLLDDKKRISEADIKYLRYLNENAYRVVIATGRRHFSALTYAQNLWEDIDIISSNGNVIRKGKSGEKIHGQYMDLSDYRKVIRLSLENNMNPIVHIDNYHGSYDILINRSKEDQVYHDYFIGESRIKTVEDLSLEDIKVLSIVFLGERHKLANFENLVKESSGSAYSTHMIENIIIAEGMLEIMNPLGNKWNGLLEYAKINGINIDEIISIGDDNNDIEMIENSSLGIAMINARPDVKSVADLISERDNNNSGVSHVLRRILENGK